MKITLYGTGYVGLVTATCLAHVGNEVLCIDSDKTRISNIKSGNIPVYELGLDTMIAENISAGRLHFSSYIEEGVEHGVYQFITVDTPQDCNGATDIQNIISTTNLIAQHMNGYRVIINKSTVPVGTGDTINRNIADILMSREKDIEFDIVSNPEFLKEGGAVEDFMKPDRIIIGCDNPRTMELMKELYTPFNHGRDRLVTMDVRSAEMTKFAANALLATKISFMNELANMAEHLAADIEQVRIGIGSDPRIGYHFIYPGCGYGGSHFPKDVKSLIHTAKEIDYQADLLSAVEAVNKRQKQRPFEKLLQYYGESLKDKTIALWGLSFKPDTDDMYDASSRVLMEALWNIGAKVKAYDPIAIPECKRIYGERDDLILCDNAETALINSDALAIVTEWQEFRSPDYKKMLNFLRVPVIIDGRNLYNPKHMKEMGFTYFGIGRGA